MAIYMRSIRNGIQEGNETDYCVKCVPPNTDILKEHSLLGQDIFKMYINGQIYSYCLDHFKELIGDEYELVRRGDVDADDDSGC